MSSGMSSPSNSSIGTGLSSSTSFGSFGPPDSFPSTTYLSGFKTNRPGKQTNYFSHHPFTAHPISKKYRGSDSDEDSQIDEVSSAIKDLALKIFQFTLTLFLATANPVLFFSTFAIGFLAKNIFDSKGKKIALYFSSGNMDEFKMMVPVIAINSAFAIKLCDYFKVSTYVFSRLGTIGCGLHSGYLFESTFAAFMPGEHESVMDFFASLKTKIKTLKPIKKKTAPIQSKNDPAPTNSKDKNSSTGNTKNTEATK